MSKTYVTRLMKAYRTVFEDSAEGKLVLMDLYEHLQGKHTSFPMNGNPFELAFNEGKRWAWLRVMAQLRIEDFDAMQMHKQHIKERRIEQQAENRQEGIM